MQAYIQNRRKDVTGYRNACECMTGCVGFTFASLVILVYDALLLTALRGGIGVWRLIQDRVSSLSPVVSCVIACDVLVVILYVCNAHVWNHRWWPLTSLLWTLHFTAIGFVTAGFGFALAADEEIRESIALTFGILLFLRCFYLSAQLAVVFETSVRD